MGTGMSEHTPKEEVEIAASEQAATENKEISPEGMPKQKKSRRKLWITLGVIAVVLVAVGLGGWTWHEQPSFCGAICHSPMDPYVDGYFSEDESLGVVGHQESDVTCLQCHEADLGQQVSEAMAWVSGDYADPLTVRRFGTVDFCGKCHDDNDASTGVDWDDIVNTTKDYQGSGRNPHDSHLGNVECYTCHSMHGQSKLYCTQCHDNIKNPSSW